MAKSIQSLLPKIIAPSCKRHGMAQHKIVIDWPYIVGEHLSKISTPIKTNFPYGKRCDGVLLIGVENPGYVLELHMIKEVILSRLFTYFGYYAISKISIRHIGLC